MAAAGPIQSPSQTNFDLIQLKWDANTARENEIIGGVRQVFDDLTTVHPALSLDISKSSSTLASAKTEVALESTTVCQDGLYTPEMGTELACQSITDMSISCPSQVTFPTTQTANPNDSKSLSLVPMPEAPALLTPALGPESKSITKPSRSESTGKPQRSKIPLSQLSKDNFSIAATAYTLVVIALATSALQSIQRSKYLISSEANYKADIIPPSTIDSRIRMEIKQTVNKEGYVYIFKSSVLSLNEPPLLKIGMATNVRSRMEEIRSRCGISDLTQVSDNQDLGVVDYSKVEKLVHLELQNFRRKYPCKKCKGKNGESTEHQEWFAVSEEVALKTVQRWRDFVKAKPWDENGILKSQWSSMIEGKKVEEMGPDADEQWDDSEKRDERWTRWLNEGKKL